MIGAIIGDIVGSRFEWNPNKSKKFELFNDQCFFTDDSVMTLAIAKAFIETNNLDDQNQLKELIVQNMQKVGQKYPKAGYGGNFGAWLYEQEPEPYNSYGNGSAMRVSSCAWVGKDLEQVLELAKLSSIVTHNHPEGIKGAQATAAAIYLARTGKSKAEIKQYIQDTFKYNLDFKLSDIRMDYEFDVTCQGSVPQAIVCFLEATDFEDCIRNAISLGGDSDTLAAIAGSIAQAYYPIPEDIKQKALSYLDDYLLDIYNQFNQKFGC